MHEPRPLEVHIESAGERWEGISVLRLSGREAISELFRFEVEVAVLDEESDLEGRAAPGVEVTVVFEQDGSEVRRLHGVLGAVRDRLEVFGARRTYSLRIHPRLHRMNAIETQEVFLDLSIPQILERKLDMHGFGSGDYELRLVGSYDPREIVVQYGETDVAFVSRLTEQAGISFFFEHEDGTDKVVFTDHGPGFGAVADHGDATFNGRGEQLGVYSLEVVRDSVPARYFVQDYNYRTPLLDPTGSFDLDPEGDGGVVEYGSHVKSPEEAARLAQVRAEERGVNRVVYHAVSSHIPVSAGRRTSVLDHPRLAAREELTVLAVEHDASFPLVEEGAARADYRNRWQAISSAVAYRPPRRTPRPRMPGFVTGVVQPGPQGEIGGVAKLTDDGRYTVQIHFDTAMRGQQKASHPVRMAQPYAGHGNSMHFPLLPGTEVVIAFANGDPDRPIIIGALPNPVSPTTIVAEEAHTHRIRSSQGVTIEFGNTVPGRQ